MFNSGKKTYFDIEQPFRFCPTGFGVDIISTTGFGAANVTNSSVWQQSENPDDIYKVTPPVLVERIKTFKSPLTSRMG